MKRAGFVFGVVMALFPLGAHAAGVTVSPAFQDVELAQGMASKDIRVTLTNQSAIGLTFALTSADFGTLDDSGGVAFLGAPATELAHRYGLVSWMTLDRNSVYLPPAGSKDVQVHIENRASLAPGGHYAALLATAVSDNGVSPTDPQVNLRQVIASLILVRKDGGAQPGLSLVDLKPTPQNWLRVPNMVELRFHDAGNVHVVPHGIVTMLDPSGKVVAKGIINEDTVVVYPESFRKITTKMLRLKTAWLPGRYKLVASYRFDNGPSIATDTMTFWYLGNALTGALIGVIALAIGIIFWIWRRKPLSP